MLMWSVGRIIDLLGEKIFFPREEKKNGGLDYGFDYKEERAAGVNLLTLI